MINGDKISFALLESAGSERIPPEGIRVLQSIRFMDRRKPIRLAVQSLVDSPRLFPQNRKTERVLNRVIRHLLGLN